MERDHKYLRVVFYHGENKSIQISIKVKEKEKFVDVTISEFGKHSF